MKSLPKTEVQSLRSDPALKPHSTWNSVLIIWVLAGDEDRPGAKVLEKGLEEG